MSKERKGEYKLECPRKQAVGVCNIIGCGFCHTTPTESNKGEWWEEKLKPKVTIYDLNDRAYKKFAEDILNTYWKELKPNISHLLSSTKKQVYEDLLKEIRQKEKPEGHEDLFSHRNKICKCTYNDGMRDIQDIIKEKMK